MSTKKSKVSKDSVEYSKIFNKLNDPCVIFNIKNQDPIIIDVNNKFVDVFCDDDIEPIGYSLNNLIVPDQNIKEAQKLDSETVDNQINEKVVTRETAYGKRDFLYRGIPLNNQKGFGIYIDITDRIQQKEYIGVLNRILRHNLRNRLTVIIGNTEIIKNSDNIDNIDNIDEKIKNISDSAERVKKLVEESDTIRDIIESDESNTRSVQLQPILYDAVDSTIDSLGRGKVEVDCSDDIYVNAGSKLNIAIESLIDNSIRYNTSKNPKVDINCEVISESEVKIKIKDNGPGIPPQEADIINRNKEINQLNHGSGLGLWMVKWVIKNYNGDIKIKKPKSGGTLVEITLNSYDSNCYSYKRDSGVFQIK